MTPQTWMVVIIAIAVLVIAALFFLRTRTQRLKSKFGTEYDRVVKERGSTLKAESELEHRAKRVESFHIRPLAREDCDEFAREWRTAQEKFVDDPRGAVADADRLVHRTMKARGYPVASEFEDRAADLSVDHPLVVQNYRAAHDIATRDARTPASTEDLRMAMKHYRMLFEDLLGRHVEETTGVRK